MIENKNALGGPGINMEWTSGAKTGVGCAINTLSNIWFTINQGILNEIYYPDIDNPCIRDMQFIVVGDNYFSEEKIDTTHKTELFVSGIPGYKISNICNNNLYEIKKEIIADPYRNCLIQKVVFSPLTDHELSLYAYLTPHINNSSEGNTGWIDQYNGFPMVFAKRDHTTMAFVSNVPWKNMSVGYVGSSDGWHDIFNNKKLTKTYDIAENGNISIITQLDIKQSVKNEFIIVIGFGKDKYEAGQKALSSIIDGYEYLKKIYLEEWQDWRKQVDNVCISGVDDDYKLFKLSAAVLKVHTSKTIPNASIASLSFPWGFQSSFINKGGYHLIWTRDLVEIAGAMIAANMHEEVKSILNYLQVTQNEDGHWAQNMWLNGEAYWSGIQMDETAFPILLVELSLRKKIIKKEDLQLYWNMIKRAVEYLLLKGPITLMDRWEENKGFSSFTVAVEISALLAAAEIAEYLGFYNIKNYLVETADIWYDNIDKWLYVKDTDWAKEYGVDGYYIKIASPQVINNENINDLDIELKNHKPNANKMKIIHLIGPDFLALVRFGLRKADDLRILNTIKIIDDKLQVRTPQGVLWYRYIKDGYGEHADGNPYDGTGIGGLWHCFTGERGHYEVASGNIEEAINHLKTMEGCTRGCRFNT